MKNRCSVTSNMRYTALIFIYSYAFISTTVDETQLCHRAKIKWDGGRTEKKLNVIYTNNQILQLEQFHNTTSACKISWKNSAQCRFKYTPPLTQYNKIATPPLPLVRYIHVICERPLRTLYSQRRNATIRAPLTFFRSGPLPSDLK